MHVHTRQGQFIYTKYLFDDLGSKAGCWSLGELETTLPDGLTGFFAHTLAELETAARADGAGSLWWTLRERVLPVLVVAKEALSVEQLVWLCGEEEEQVCG